MTRPAICLLLFLSFPWVARAEVDLVTIPTREGVQLTIYNSEDITMVREHRLLTMKQGVNRIQFSWANTLIDPTSIDFRILDHQDRVDVLDTTFPADRTDALQWNISSSMDGQVPVEIRYFTSGITWSADYVGIANQDETKLRLTGYVQVRNDSGELYDNAQTRLVVGTINLVEKITDLATRPPVGGWKYNQLDAESKSEVRKTFDDALKAAEKGEVDAGAAPAPADKPAEVIKQGLSEYFLFTIDGRENIQDGEPKRLVSLKVQDVPLEVVYKLTDRESSDHFTKFYRFKNLKLLDEQGQEQKLSAMNNLGVSPLPDGQVRLFFEYANQDLAYSGGTTTKYVPLGDRVEVNVGRDPDITILRRLKDQSVRNVTARQYQRRVDDTYVWYYDMLDYDETFVFEEEIVSGKPVDVKTEVERQFDADVFLWGSDGPPEGWEGNAAGAYVDMHEIAGRVERVDQNQVKYFVDLKPGERCLVRYTVTYNRRQVGPELNGEKKREPL